MIKLDYDEIWYWHEQIEKFLKQPSPQKQFCEENGVEYKKFTNMMYRIVYKSVKHPEEYKALVPIARKYMASGLSASKFSKENKIDLRILSEMVTHLNYVDIIEKLKAEKEKKPMQFIQVPTVQNAEPRPAMVEAEVVKKQNSVELIISQGVKVVVAPEVGADKLIRIIELLKDL